MNDLDEALETLGYPTLDMWALDHGFRHDEQRSMWMNDWGYHILLQDMHGMILNEARFIEDLDNGNGSLIIHP